MATATFRGTYTANGGEDYASGTVTLTPRGGSPVVATLDAQGTYSVTPTLVLTSSTGLWLDAAGNVVTSQPSGSGVQLIPPGGTVTRTKVLVEEDIDGAPPKSFLVDVVADQVIDTGRDVGTVLGGTASGIGVDIEAVKSALSGTYVPTVGAEQAVATPLVFDGGKPWWDARNLATLQAAITAATAAGGGVIRVEVPLALGTAEVVFPDGVDVQCVGRGHFTSTTTGSAITFFGQNYGNSVVKIRRTSIGWEAADLSDTSSVGVTLKNCNWGFYNLREVQNFETGVLFWGDATGTAYNTVANGRTNDNKRGHRYLATGVNGHANANYVFGGAIRISNFSGTPGSIFVDMSVDGNGNTYSQVNLEGVGAEKIVVVLASDNMFLNCRQESNPVGSWHFLPTSINNYVIGGYGLLGPNDPHILDESVLRQNVIIGGRGMNIASDANNPAVTTRALGSNGNASYVGYNISGQRVARILAGGQFESYLGTDPTHPRVKLDVTGGPGGYGGVFVGRGNVAPTNAIGVNAGGNGIASNVNLEVITAGQGLRVKEGTNAKQGVVTLAGGTFTVPNTSVTANSRIFLTVQSLGTVTVPKSIGVTARSAGTSFTITSEDATDTSVVAWEIFEPAA